MKLEKIENPMFDSNDKVVVLRYNSSICEVSRFHYDKKIETERDENKKWPFKGKYVIAKELKYARSLIFTNVQPEDLPFTYFVTITDKNLTSLDKAREAFNEFDSLVTAKFGKHKHFAFFQKSEGGGYHIHALLFNPTHCDKFQFIKFNKLASFADGQTVVKKPKNYFSLVNIAFYVTRKEKFDTKLKVNQSVFDLSKDLDSVPSAEEIDEFDLSKMKELFSSSYRITSDNLDVTIKRSFYIAKDLVLS